MEVHLANQDSAGSLQTSRNLGILLRYAVVEYSAGGGGADTGGVDVVLQSDGNAMKRSTEAAAPLLGIEHTRLFQRRFPGD